MASYIALIRKDADSDFGVDFPDFRGCVSAGATLDEARRMAQEALEFHVAGMIADGQELPIPSSLDAIIADPDNHDAVAFLVTVSEIPDSHRASQCNAASASPPAHRRARNKPLCLLGSGRRESSRGRLIVSCNSDDL